jgi:hypothetical protein
MPNSQPPQQNKQHRRRSPKRPESKRPDKDDAKPVVAAATDSTPEAHLCPVCTEVMQYAAYGECNHPLCHLCSLRLRALYDNNLCALCKTDLKSVVYVSVAAASAEDFQAFSTYDLRRLPMQKKLGIYCVEQTVLDEVVLLLRHNCPDSRCSESFKGWNDLKHHVKKQHQLMFW